MRLLKGLPCAPGIASGPAHVVMHGSLEAAARHAEDAQAELERLERALKQAQDELRELAARSVHQVGKEAAAIFDAHEAMLRDPELLGRVRSSVQKDRLNIEFAWQEAVQFYAAMLRNVADEYLAARAADVEDVGRRVLGHLKGESAADHHLERPSIIIADDLTPADTVLFDRSLVLGFCTRGGGPTAHAAILAKALGVPCVAGLSQDALNVGDAALLVVDGDAGEVCVEPDAETQQRYAAMAAGQARQRAGALERSRQPATTSDGMRVEVVANVGSVADAEEAVRNGAEGIGLLRTEFLFLDRPAAPSEEEQVEAYARIFRVMGPGEPIVVRTLDIGGDKPASYLDMPKESNPFLGLRGIRLSLRFPELLECQLRALLIAGSGFDLRIMFPMVASMEELIAAREAVERCLTELKRAKRSHCVNPQVGIMVEVPSAAIMARSLAAKADFFSIGTNDLSQYTLAAERTGASVAYLADPLHPAVLRLIRGVIHAAHACSKWVGVCGEMAGDPEAVPILLGLGLDEFSASPRSIPRVKETLASLETERARLIADEALDLTTASEVHAYMQAANEDRGARGAEPRGR